jgi:hypothetical protein
MRLRMAGLFMSLLLGALTVLLSVKSVRGFPDLPRRDDYEDVTPALWSSLSPIQTGQVKGRHHVRLSEAIWYH